MNKSRLLIIISIVFAVFTFVGEANSSEIRVAVASNFSVAIKALSKRFEEKTGYRVVLIFGSTGKHYAQIKHGAPYDIFFAADKARPKLLEEEGVSIPLSRFTYAVGQLVLWSPQKGVVGDSLDVLHQDMYRYLALANPRLAPYGAAAQEVLQAAGLWERLQNKMVKGENIGQTFQFVQSGNAELGFVAYSQVKTRIDLMEGSAWIVPPSWHTPIEQQAVLLKDNSIARDFITFIKSVESKTLIENFGYRSL